jgi:hypothetical protein
MARVIPVIAVLAAASCDAVFGLDSSNIVHDEDGDGVDDRFDNCPADPNTDQADSDGDHVGDVCDPHPMQAGDAIAFFDAFPGDGSDGLIASGWQLPGVGNWQHGNDSYVESDNLEGTAYLLELGQTFQNATVEIHFRQTTAVTDGQFGAYAIITGSGDASGNPDGLHCNQVVASGSDSLHVSTNPMPAPEFDPASTDEIVLRVSADGTCNAQDGAGSSVTTIGSAVAGGGPIGLQTVAAGAEFDSVVVYTSP